MSYVLPLSEIRLADADRVGRKAAVLGELLAAGFTVPAGFAVTVDAFAASGGDTPSSDLVDELRDALRGLGSGQVAVRSSGIDEDLADMSYAGQYESVLGVSGLEAVVEALRVCWASAGSERVQAYRTAHRGPARLGVLVQTMVDASAAGIAYSSNPLTGDGSETVISAVSGLGDRLAAGEVDADEWTVRNGVATMSRRSPAAPAIDAFEACTVARLARRIADVFGTPQDIEWAFADGTLWLLQARPITALPPGVVEQIPIEIQVPAGHSIRNGSMDRPWTPMERSVFLPVFSAALRHMHTFTTGAVPMAQSIGGWVYITMYPDSTEAAAGRVEHIAAAIADGRPRELIQRWHETWKPAFAREIAELRDVHMSTLTDASLHAHIRAIVSLFDRLHDRYFQLTGAAIAVMSKLTTVCGELFGWTGQQTVRLRGGLAGDHMAATVRLSELARLAADRPAVCRFLAKPDATPEALADRDADFAEAFADYVRRYAHRTVGFDLTEPTVAERPAVLLALIRAQLAQPYDFAAERAAIAARRDQALAEARELLADRPAADTARFEAALEASVLSSPVRDEKVFYAVFVWALLRYATLEIGRRLVERGAIDQADDALFLELTEALSALSSGTDQRARIRHHKGQHAWATANPGPPTYGEPPSCPAGAPSGPPPRIRAVDDGLRGLAVSPGRYLGPVRVIRNITEFGKLRHGDVLVCPETTAQWSMLFPSVGALVTDRGSLLSHPAIIAREYGVPAVVATETATSVLRDDQLVIVDGSTGVVRTVSSLAAPTIDLDRAAA